MILVTCIGFKTVKNRRRHDVQLRGIRQAQSHQLLNFYFIFSPYAHSNCFFNKAFTSI
jgi:hypothetical protein